MPIDSTNKDLPFDIFYETKTPTNFPKGLNSYMIIAQRVAHLLSVPKIRVQIYPYQILFDCHLSESIGKSPRICHLTTDSQRSWRLERIL